MTLPGGPSSLRLLARTDQIPAKGLRFVYLDGPFEEEGILLRLASGEVRAFKNECRHQPIRLDEREPRELWDAAGNHLTCNAHGALYRPVDGLCIAGPCKGSHLKRLPIVVVDGSVALDTSRLGSFFEPP